MSTYFEYFQIGRGYYMPTACPNGIGQKHMFVIAHIEFGYHFKELKLLANKPSIKIRTASLRCQSFEIEYLITSFDNENNEGIQMQKVKVFRF